MLTRCEHAKRLNEETRLVTGIIPTFSRKLWRRAPDLYRPSVAVIRCEHDGGSITTYRALNER